MKFRSTVLTGMPGLGFPKDNPREEENVVRERY
jgi:hypothetical protein